MNEENKCKMSYFQGPGFTEVRYLHWHGYPLKLLPSNIHPEKLVLLEMPHSNIEQLFDSVQDYGKLNQIITAAFNFFSKIPTPSLTQHLNNLVILNLSGCKNLQSLPARIHLKLLKELDLSGCSKLKRLPEISPGNITTMHLDGTALEELPSSIECLSKLSHLGLADCKSLKSLPSGLCKLKSLDVLIIDGCSNLQRLPEELGNLEALDILHAIGTSITEVPPSIVRLKRVRGIYFGRNKGLSLPITFSVDGLQNLRDLNLNDCGIMELPESLGLLSSVTTLHLEGNNFERIPESIIQLSNLERLFIRYCERLQSLPKLPCNLLSLDAHHCTALESLPGLFPSSDESYLRTLYLSDNFKLDRNEIRGIVKGALQKIQLLATARLREAREKISYPSLRGRGFLPWNKIPKWFSFQSAGSCVTLEMPPDFFNNKSVLGLAFSVIVNFSRKFNFFYTSKIEKQFYVYCEYIVRPKDYHPHCSTSRMTLLGVGDCVVSDHLFFGYYFFDGEEFNDFRKYNCVPVAVRFNFREANGFEFLDYPVKKCGIRLFHAPDSRESFSCD
ncbi:Disease resistance-like protein DSC1 [Citrus sinensis]|nr:Disease resistance-like protein DSC1 [Citrus sinensis]